MGIQVMATRTGQYGPTGDQARIYQEGELFEVENESQLGTWMARVDGKKNPALEKAEKARAKMEAAGNQFPAIDPKLIKATPTQTKAEQTKATKKAQEAAKKAQEAQAAKDLV